MANFRYCVTDARDGWHVKEPATDKTLRTCSLPSEANTRHNLLLVGGKSTFHDGGALTGEPTAADRLAAMDKRWGAVINGVWRFNDGRGGAKQPKFPRPELFAAVVACGHMPDDAKHRELWMSATEITFAKAYQQKGVIEWLEKHQPADDTGLFADASAD